jgi:hypothetical protein
MFTVILSVESVNFFTFSLIYLCKLESQKGLAQFTDAGQPVDDDELAG